MIKSETELAFPDWNEPFHLYPDASDIQLGATLVQKGKPLGFYTRKMNAAQLNYTVGERIKNINEASSAKIYKKGY